MLNERAGVGTGQIKTKFLAPRRIICPEGQREGNKRQGRGEERGKGVGGGLFAPGDKGLSLDTEKADVGLGKWNKLPIIN